MADARNDLCTNQYDPLACLLLSLHLAQHLENGPSDLENASRDSESPVFTRRRPLSRLPWVQLKEAPYKVSSRNLSRPYMCPAVERIKDHFGAV